MFEKIVVFARSIVWPKINYDGMLLTSKKDFIFFLNAGSDIITKTILYLLYWNFSHYKIYPKPNVM